MFNLFKKNAASDTRISIGGVPIPADLETLNLLLAGAPGAGKSLGFEAILERLRARGGRAIVNDPNGEYLSKFAHHGDVLLNPFDTRGQGWSIFSEIRSPHDCQRLAKSIIPDGFGSDASWRTHAQGFTAAILQREIDGGEVSTERLVYLLAQAPASELLQILHGHPLAQFCIPANERFFGSVRSILATYLPPLLLPEAGDFSIRRWVDEGTGCLFITHRDDTFQAVRPLVSTWLDIAISAALSLPPDFGRRLFFLLDEVDTLERLDSLIPAASKLRKHGGVVVLGIQALSQLEERYGREGSMTILNCMGTWWIGRASDAHTAKAASEHLGDVEIERQEESETFGETDSRSISSRRVVQQLVLPSEIMNLAPRTGFLKLPGDFPVALVTIPIVQRHQRTEPFIQRISTLTSNSNSENQQQQEQAGSPSLRSVLPHTPASCDATAGVPE